MPTTAVGLYEVTLEQRYFQSEVLNVFHYLSATADDDVQTLCGTAFNEDVQPTLANLANASFNFENIRVRNITGTLADANIIPAVAVGVRAGSIVADFVCSAFRYNRTTKDTRNGSKRFSGLVEADILGASFESSYAALLDAAAVVLGTDISTIGGIFTPVILRKPDDGFGNWTYNLVSSVVSLNRLTTQNSRKTF